MSNPNTYEMTVTRLPDGGHSPLYDENWPPVTQLAWHAGIVALDTGLRITVRDFEGDRYSIAVRGGTTLTGLGPMGFHQAWSYLDGVRTGAQAVRR
ncbi:hypothetical protein [Streptomyces sp. NPDC006638]|uniref:hypothetical protein n=1 Tax=Streptomyces sp. NPDC006638 TaxID=3157183 RepID=UPI0033A36708